jgi:urease accessory protein
MNIDDRAFLQTDESFLGALQLGDSLFPSGRYTLSHGLEMFVESGRVVDAASLEAVVRDYLTESLATCETVAVARANEAAIRGDLDQILRIDHLVHALRLPWEVSSSSTRTGRQLVATSRQLVASPILDRFADEIAADRAVGSHAVVFGLLTAAWNIDARTAALAELYAYTAAFVGAAMRLIRLDHVEAQTIIHRLQQDMTEAADIAMGLRVDDMHAFAPLVDIMQMQHERARMRLFAS